jgi:hypothetical protein
MLIPRACVKQQELLKRSFCVCEVPNMVVHHYYCHEFPPVTYYGKAKERKLKSECPHGSCPCSAALISYAPAHALVHLGGHTLLERGERAQVQKQEAP